MPPRERFSAGGAKIAEPRPRRRATAGKASKYEARQLEIVREAVEPLNRHGIRGMTLSEISARLGLAPTAVSYYFNGKEELAASCYIASLDRLSRLIDEAETAPPGQGVHALIRSFFDFRRRVEDGDEPEVAWYEDMRTIRNPEVDRAYIAFFRRVRGLFPRPENQDDRARANLVTHQLLSQFYWAVSWLPAYHPGDYGRLADRFIDILENGLAAPGRSWAPRSLGEALAESSDTDDARRDFLRAATELVNELGYLGASVQKISERVNVTKGSFYHHHSGKTDLVAQCFERTFDIVRRAQTAADDLTDNGLDNLASASLWLVEAHGTGKTPMLRSAAMAAAPGELRPDLVAGFLRVALRFSTVVSDGIGDGSIRPVDSTMAGHMISGAVNAGAELQFWAPGIEPSKGAELYLRPLFEGLLPRVG